MRKRVLRLLGGFLVLGGIFLMVTAGKVAEASKPREIQTGYYSGGRFVATDTGYIGGNAQAEEDMGSLKVIGVMTMIVGGVMFAVSFKAEED